MKPFTDWLAEGRTFLSTNSAVAQWYGSVHLTVRKESGAVYEIGWKQQEKKFQLLQQHVVFCTIFESKGESPNDEWEAEVQTQVQEFEQPATRNSQENIARDAYSSDCETQA